MGESTLLVGFFSRVTNPVDAASALKTPIIRPDPKLIIPSKAKAKNAKAKKLDSNIPLECASINRYAVKNMAKLGKMRIIATKESAIIMLKEGPQRELLENHKFSALIKCITPNDALTMLEPDIKALATKFPFFRFLR